MSIRLTKPWLKLDDLDSESLPAQLGVFQFADADQRVVFIGYGGGDRLFGLRSAVEAHRAESAPDAVFIRYELTHGYLSRWEELMMVHAHDHGAIPEKNDPATAPRGRLTPIAGGDS